MHLRLQWKTEVVRGQSTKVEVDMAGVSLVVMGGLQVRDGWTVAGGLCGRGFSLQNLATHMRTFHYHHHTTTTTPPTHNYHHNHHCCQNHPPIAAATTYTHHHCHCHYPNCRHQDELFNLTTDEIKTSAISTRLELQVGCLLRACGAPASCLLRACSTPVYACCAAVQLCLAPVPSTAAPQITLCSIDRPTSPRHCHTQQVEGTVQKVQLDNQMLDAVQPVVLAPAVEYRPSGAVASSAKEPPLISFSFTRSYAGSGAAGGDSGGDDGGSVGGASEASARAAAEGDRQSIKSFKDIRLDVGACRQLWSCAWLVAGYVACSWPLPT